MAGVADVARVEVAWASDPWQTTTPTFTDLTDLSAAELANRGSVNIQVTKGREGGHGTAFIPSTLTVTFNNNDADFDEFNSGTVFGAANLVRNKRIRVLVSDDTFTGSNQLFDGYISDVQPFGDELSGGAVITARDLLGVLAEYDVNGLTRGVELTGVRAAAILDDVGLPSAFRGTIDNGNVLMPAATLESDALSLLQQCQKAEFGVMYAEDGVLLFRDRYAILDETAWSVRQHSFTADGNGATSKILREPMRRTLGGFDTVSRVAASREGGDTTVVYDTTATDYPPITPATGPYGLQVAYDADVQVAAQAWHDGLLFDGERVDSFRVLVYPGHSNAVTAVEAGYYDPLTRVEVQSTPKGGATDFNFEARIEQVTHTIDVDRWYADVRVSPYNTEWQDDGQSLWYEYGEVLSGSDLGGL